MIPHISKELLPGVVSTHSLNGTGWIQVTEEAYGEGVGVGEGDAAGVGEIEYVTRTGICGPVTPGG
jgi:hypothetical protein